MRGITAAVAAWLLWTGSLPAQESTIDTGCFDRANEPIRGVVDNALRFAGVATILPDGAPVIYVNERTLSKASSLARRFVLLHECAHHRLRHVYREASRAVEIEADCWAIQHLVEREMVKPKEIDRLQEELGPSRGLGSLRGCLDVKEDPALWRKSLDLLTLAGAHKFAPIRGSRITEDPERGFFESTLDLPGTFNCELTPAMAFSCQVYHGDNEHSAADRFRVIRRIIEGWLSHEWLTFERIDPRPGERRRLVAQRISSGALLTLVATDDHRLLFRYEPPE